MTVQTGSWTTRDSLLALYRLYVNGADDELAEMEIERKHLLSLIYALDGEESEYRRTELVTIARQMVKAYNLGVGEALK